MPISVFYVHFRSLTFHFHILGFAKLLLAGFLLLLLSVVMMVHVGNCCDVMMPVIFVPLDLVRSRFRGEPGSELLRRLRMRRRDRQVEPRRLGLF